MCQVYSFFGCCSLKAGAITAAVLHSIIAFACLVSGIYFVIELEYGRIVFEAIGRSFLGIGSLFTFSTIFLILGIIKEQPGFVMVWLVFEMMFIVLSGIIFAFVIYYRTFAALIGLPEWIFWLYLWIVVLSYHNSLRQIRQPAIILQLQQGVVFQSQPGVVFQSQPGMVLQPQPGMVLYPQSEIIAQTQPGVVLQQPGCIVQPQAGSAYQTPQGIVYQPQMSGYGIPQQSVEVIISPQSQTYASHPTKPPEYESA